MSETTTPTNSTAPADSTDTSSTEETTAKDPDRWDDEPEVEESDGDEPKPEKKAEVKKKPTKEETEKEEKKAADQRERRLRKMMIDGKEEVIDEEEAIRSYAKNRAADKRLQEAAEARKQLDAFREQFEKDPLAVLSSKNLPINKRELAQKWLKESIAEELKDPLQVQLEEKEAKLREYEEKELTAKQQAEAKEQEQKSSARREELAKVFGLAMENSVLSKDPAHAAEVLREMAMYARIAKQADPDAPLPTPEELATHVENQRLKQYHSVAQTLSGDQLIQFMGEAIVNKIRKADLERIKKQRGMSEEPETVESDSWSQSDSKKTKERKFIDPVSMREVARKRIGL
jgi:hypothetical protein